MTAAERRFLDQCVRGLMDGYGYYGSMLPREGLPRPYPRKPVYPWTGKAPPGLTMEEAELEARRMWENFLHARSNR